jgi:hypothetical protein
LHRRALPIDGEDVHAARIEDRCPADSESKQRRQGHQLEVVEKPPRRHREPAIAPSEQNCNSDCVLEVAAVLDRAFPLPNGKHPHREEAQ